MGNPKIPQHTESLYDFTLTSASGDVISMEQYRGQVLLIVNTASQCGFTGQYTGLQSLHETYKARGLCVIAVPCNQFGAQEPADDSEIQAFCQRNFAVDFAVMAKTDVNGARQSPLYQYLKGAAGGLLTDNIKWNFTKFLVDRQGQVVSRHPPTTKPDALAAKIERLLAKPSA